MGIQNVWRGRQRSHRYSRDDENRSGTNTSIDMIGTLGTITKRYLIYLTIKTCMYLFMFGFYLYILQWRSYLKKNVFTKRLVVQIICIKSFNPKKEYYKSFFLFSTVKPGSKYRYWHRFFFYIFAGHLRYVGCVFI